MAYFVNMGKQPRNQESKECGKHIGSCDHCGFSLLADRDEKCPRCETPIKENANA